MKRTIALLFLLAFCFAIAAQAQAPAAKPSPEFKKLRAGGLGHWTYEGTYKPGPLGPGGNFSGEFTGQMILGGFFFRGRWTEKGAAGESHGMELDGYDAVNKNFSSEFYIDDGDRFSGTLTVTENTWTYSGKYVIAGKPYQFKGTFVVAPDGASGNYTAELSSGGQTWVPWFDCKYTKVQPAAKK